MAKKIVVADTSPLIALARIDLLSLLPKLLGEVIIPKAVAEESLADLWRKDSIAIKNAIDNKILKIIANPNTNYYQELSSILDAGEVAAIALAVKLKSSLLIDEKLGRRAALKQNLKIIGTAGVLLLAKEKKLIKKVNPFINQLRDTGYFLSSDLIEHILKIAGEKPTNTTQLKHQAKKPSLFASKSAPESEEENKFWEDNTDTSGWN